MPRKAQVKTNDLLRLVLPGNLRVQLSAYLPDIKQYHPVPGLSARVTADNQEQARELWEAVVARIREVVEGTAAVPARVYPGWPPVGDGIVDGFGIVGKVDDE